MSALRVHNCSTAHLHPKRLRSLTISNTPPPPTHTHTQFKLNDDATTFALTKETASERTRETMDLRQVDPSHDDSLTFAGGYSIRTTLRQRQQLQQQQQQRQQQQQHGRRERCKCKVAPPTPPTLWFALALLNLVPTIGALAFGK